MKSIKKFFKWIADHTGISWVARKISSGWKWLFGGKANATQQNTSQQEKSSGNERQEPAQVQSKGATTPKTLDNEVNPDQSIPPAAPDEPQGTVINTSETDAEELPENFLTPNPKNADSDVLKEASNENYLKVGDKGLLLVLTSEQFAKCKDYKDSQSTSPGGLLMYIKCGENEYRIAGTNNDNLPNTICIKSILEKSKDGKYVNGNIVLVEEEIKHVKKMLELNNDGVVKVDSISNKPFGAPTLEQPKPNTATTQQTVNNNSNGEATAEIKQVSSSTTASLTEQLPEVNSTQELSTPNNEPVRIDTPDQPKSPAVPNEPQETLVNAYEEKGKPNNAEEVQPEVSNKEVAAEEHASSLTTADQALEQSASDSDILPEDLSEVASPSGSQSTTADSNEPKSERIEAPTLEQPNSNNNILNQQPAGPGGLLNNKGPQSTTPNQPVNQDNMAGQDSSKIGETQNSPTTDLTVDNISDQPFKNPASEQPNTNATGNGTAQPNDSNVDEEVEKGLVDRASTTDQQPEASADGSTSSSDSSSFVVVKEDGNASPESPEASERGTPTDTTGGSLSDPESTAEELSGQPEANLKGHIEAKDGQLELVVSQDQKDLVLKSENSDNKEEFLVYITCDTGNFRITCVHHQGDIFHINSVKPQSAEESVVTGELEKRKELLGVNDTKEKVKIYSISRDPITPASSESKAPANDDELSSLVTAPEVQTAGNDKIKQ